MSEHVCAPIRHPLRTRGMAITLLIIAVGVFFGAKRFIFGIGSVTHLNDQFPWGLWIAIDVATGVALAAGGFTTAALVHVFGKERFHGLMRPALLTAALGYTFVAIGIMADLGRYWNIWRPMTPAAWQGNSVLFEVAICVMCYLTVLYLEFMPIVLERLREIWAEGKRLAMITFVDNVLGKMMFLFIIAGIVLSCLHQSSLGNLMVIAPSKIHALWYTPLLPLFFLISAIAVGFPMVIFESLLVSRGFKREAEMDLLTPLARYVAPFLGLYLALRIGDLLVREAMPLAFTASVESLFFWLEIGLGIALPMVLFALHRVRRHPTWLLTAAALYVVFGVALGRVNVFLVAYRPPYADKPYFPSFGEFAITAGLIACLVLIYRLAVTYLPVLPRSERSDLETPVIRNSSADHAVPDRPRARAGAVL